MILAFSLWDAIRIPFGWLLDVLYQFTNSYGIALLLFSLLLKLIMLPISAKSKKSMMAMSRISPLAKLINEKYPDDPTKAQMELRKLYKDEGVSMTGGCLWTLIPLLILIPLYHVIREPITYMLHFSADEAAAVVTAMKGFIPDAFGSNSFYDQLISAAHLTEYAPQLVEAVPSLAGRTLESLNFSFLGIDLSQVPTWQFWRWTLDWNTIGAFLIPVLSAGSNIISMLISRKMNAKVATDENGEVDEAAAKADSTGKVMMWMSPIMSLWIGFAYPCALSLYWLSQGVFGILQDVLLTLHYRKIYNDEDEIKRRAAAERAAIEAEKERVRAQRRAENPDGITANTSKKKLQNKQQVQKEQSVAAARRAAQAASGEDEPLSGDPERPFAKGHAYRADRYAHGSETEE